MDPPTKSTVPSLSVVVPTTPNRMPTRSNVAQHIWQPVAQTPGRTRNVIPAKQKRLFPIACRVVPLDLWFTTRVDRTWQVQDLKVWLLSKALPDSALTLPPSYRPSSPVTFAAPPPPMPATHLHPSPPHSPQAGNGSPRGALGSSPPPSPYDYLFGDDDVSLYAPSYYTVDSVEDGRVRPMTPSRSVAYSFSTGAPSISGLEALKASNMRTSNRTFPGASDGKDPELWKRATELADKWCIYSFSTGMQLSEDMAISEYRIRSFELLELHQSNSYVQLPRTLLPSARALSPPLLAPSGPASRAYRGTRFKQPPPFPPRDFFPDETDSEEEDPTTSRAFSGSPYAQPYFECWAWLLRNPADPEELQRKAAKRRMARGGEMSLVTSMDEGDSIHSPERWKRVWMTVRQGMLRVHKDKNDPVAETKYEIARCAALQGPDKLEGLNMGIGQKRSLASSSTINKYIICARFRHHPVVSTGKPSRTSSKSKQQYYYQNPNLSTWLIFKVGDRDIHENLLRILHRLSYSSPIALADSIPPSSRPHSRSTVGHSTSNPSISVAHSIALLHQRTLRTDFLPNPIPHPLSLRFSAPSPPGDSSPLSPNFTSSFDLDDEPLGESSGSGNRLLQPRRDSVDQGLGRRGMGMGSGKGMSLRFPEWREDVVRRAIEAGLGWGELELHHGGDGRASTPVARTGHGVGASDDPAEVDMQVVQPEGEGEPIFFGGYDTDDDDGAGSDTFSELEWDGWAYDLDRPKGTAGFGGRSVATGKVGSGALLAKKGLKTPNASPASATDEEDNEIEGGWESVPLARTRLRARSVIGDTPTSPRSPTTVASTSTGITSSTDITIPPVPSTSTSTRVRASTVSARSTPPPRFADDSPRYILVPKTPVAGSSSFSQAQIPGQGGEGSASGIGMGGRKGGIMRGFNMKVGRESFKRGLENALDFVEGK